MNCREAQTLIHKELDGRATRTSELSEGERQELERHFEACRACAAKRDGLARLLGAARDIRLRDGPPPDLARTVAKRVHRQRRFRVALGAGLAAAAALLLCLTLWPRAEPAEVPGGAAVRRPPARQASVPEAEASESVAELSPADALAWLKAAWQRTASGASVALPSLKVSLLPEELGPQGRLQEELRETKRTLLQLAREVREQVFPFELPRTESRRQNG